MASVVSVVFLLICVFSGIYFAFKSEIQNVRLRHKQFSCVRCGLCCGFLVKLNSNDVGVIEKAGHPLREVITKRLGISFLKRKEGKCVFFEMQDDGTARCLIYENRPEVCRKFPRVAYLGLESWDSRCKGIF